MNCGNDLYDMFERARYIERVCTRIDQGSVSWGKVGDPRYAAPGTWYQFRRPINLLESG